MTDAKQRQPKPVDAKSVSPRTGSRYPAEFKGVAGRREKRALGDACGLTHYGVNLVHLPPGAWSSQRHWHSHEDEFVYVLEGELTLVTDAGDQILTPGMSAGFPANCADGHHLINRSDRMAVYLEVGDRSDDDKVDYPDIDMKLEMRDGEFAFLHKNGKPYPTE